MPSTPHWTEWNTNSTSTTGTRADCNWKVLDDSTTAYSASPITAGNYSMSKLQALAFDSGAWNNLSVLAYSASASSNTAGGISVFGNTISTAYTNQSTTTIDAAMVTTAPGIAANFTTGAASNIWAAGSTTIAGVSTNPVYGALLRTQLKTATSAPPGDMTPIITLTATWTES